MKNLKVTLSVLAASIMLSSCSDDEPEAPHVYRRVIDFENTGLTLAGPTSYGENLYKDYNGETFVIGSIEVEKGVNIEFGVNYSEYYDTYDFTAGGMVLSQWNYRSNIEGKTGNWWYNFQNQCSVYNTNSTDGENKSAGAEGSNTFAVINGFNTSAPSFNMTADAEYLVEKIEICPNSYLYGVITEGNAFGNDPGKSLAETNGWFKILAYGYDAQGNPTNGGNPVEKYICDYRTGANIAIESTWQTWDLTALGRVNKIKFDFEGSDTGAYGLNTPAYMCIDNITLRMN